MSPVGALAQKSERRGISPCTELLALLGLRMPCQVGIFEDALAPPARTLLVLAVGEQRAFGAGWPRLSGGPPALAATAAAPWLAAAALNPPRGGFCALLAR